jgi:hypothetical protein
MRSGVSSYRLHNMKIPFLILLHFTNYYLFGLDFKIPPFILGARTRARRSCWISRKNWKSPKRAKRKVEKAAGWALEGGGRPCK